MFLLIIEFVVSPVISAGNFNFSSAKAKEEIKKNERMVRKILCITASFVIDR
jgi:hypothetical protein